MSDHFQKELAFLGIDSSPAFVRAPEGNGCAERFIRTLKENLLWVRTFETIEELRQALLAFRETYNNSWLIERHGFLTPAQFRQKRLQNAAIAAEGSIRCPKNRRRYSGNQRDCFRRQYAMHGRDLPLHHIWIGYEAVDGNRRRERGKKGEKCLERCSTGESRKVVLSDMPPRSRQDRPDACRFRLVSGRANHQLLGSAST